MTGKIYTAKGAPLKWVMGKLKEVTPENEAMSEALVNLVEGIPTDANTPELIEHRKFWEAMDGIVKIWSHIDPDGMLKYRDNTKGVTDSQWDRRYAATKNKNIRWRARMPFLLVAIIKRLFPNFALTDEFGKRFVARYRVFQIGEKS